MSTETIEVTDVEKNPRERAVVRLHPVNVYGAEVYWPNREEGRETDRVLVAVVGDKVVQLSDNNRELRLPEWVQKQVLKALGRGEGVTE